MKTINIFVSHHHSDAETIKQLTDLMGKLHNYELRDSSIYEEKSPNKAHNEDYIMSLIRPKIDWAGTIIVLIGDKTRTSEWVEWEIEYANRHGKQIIGVFERGLADEDALIPDGLSKYADQITNWNSENINKALDGEPIFTNASGGSRSSGGMDRGEC